MTITLTAPVIIGLLSLLALQVAQLILIGRWTGRTQALVERHERSQGDLEVAKDQHATQLAALQTTVTNHDQEITRLREAKHDQGSRLAGLDKMCELVWRRFEDLGQGSS